jgi:hypothetical protein
VDVGGADRIAVPRLAVDPLAGVPVDGVITDQDDGAIREQMAQEETREGTALLEG